MVVTRNEENTVNVRGSIEQSDGIMGHSVCLTRDENTLGNLALLEHNCIQNYDMSRNDTAEVTRGATASRKRRREERDGNLQKRRKANNSEILLSKDTDTFPSEIDVDRNNDVNGTPMKPRLKRQFESLFGDSKPTPSMMKKIKATIEKPPITPRLKRKIDLLFGDDGDQPTIKKKTKLDDFKAKAPPTAEETPFLKAFELGHWHDKAQLMKLTNLPMTSIDRLAKKHCRRVVPHSRKSKGKPDLRLQLIEEEEKAAAVSSRTSSSKEAIVMRQRHQKRLKTLKLDGSKSDDKIKDSTSPVVVIKQPQLEPAASNRPIEWKIPRILDAANSTTALWINETTSPLGQIDQLPKKLLGWKIPS